MGYSKLNKEVDVGYLSYVKLAQLIWKLVRPLAVEAVSRTDSFWDDQLVDLLDRLIQLDLSEYREEVVR